MEDCMKQRKFSKLFLSLMMVAVLLPSSIMKPTQTKAVQMEEVVTVIDDAEVGTGINQFQFHGTWISASGVASDYMGSEHWSNKGRWLDTPPSITLRFKGNKFELFGKKENVGGIYKVVIDGDEEHATTIDTYNLTPQSQERLYVVEGLEEKEHTITFTIIKEINAMAGTYDSVNVGAVIDFAKVYSLEVVDSDKNIQTVVDDSDITTSDELFKIQYNGKGWSAESGYPDLFVNGSDHYSNDKSASYKLSFIGNSIELIASKNINHADYNVYIDGVLVGEANAKLPSGNTKHKQSIFKIDNLTEEQHTLEVSIKDSSSGAIQIDAINILHKAIMPTGVEFNVSSLTIEAGMSERVVASLTPSYANAANILYAIDNQELATISKEGEVTGKKAGETFITATIENSTYFAKLPLTILPEGMPLSTSVGSIHEHATQEDYKKVLSQTITSWSDVAWRGDTLNSKIDIATRKSIHNATIKASDFKSETATISSSVVEINWLKETLANIGRGNSSAPVKAFPDVIHKGGKKDIAAKRVQSAWININVPKDAKPGIYTGTLTLQADELEEPLTYKYTFEVLDLQQPNTQDMSTQIQIWQHPFAVASYYDVDQNDYFKEPHFDYMRASMREYRDMGGRDVVANIVEEAWNHQSYTSDPSMVKWTKKADGSFAYDYSWFDQWVNFNIEEGVLDPINNIGQIKCYSIVPWGNKISYYNEVTKKMESVNYNTGTQDWKDMWKPFLEDFMKHTQEKGWYDITYIAMDERGINDLRNSVELIESVKDNTGSTFKISSAFNYQSGNDYSFLDRIDDISIGLSHINDASDDMRAMSQHRKELGLITTIYTCTGDYPSNYTISNMSDNAWTMWYSLSQNTDGFMRWAWDNWVSDPLANVTYKYWEPGDGWFIYPTEKNTKSTTYFYKTPRYELLKQGVRDINKAKYLMEHSDTISPKVDALVKSLQRPNAGSNGYGSAVAASKEEQALTDSEVLRMREGIMELSREFIKEQEVPVTSIEVDKENVDLYVGEDTTIIATAKPDNATNKTLIWTSEDESIASVNTKGQLHAVQEGITNIVVRTPDATIQKNIRVRVSLKQQPTIEVESIQVRNDRITLKENETFTIVTTLSPSNATDPTLTWVSSNPSVVLVDNGIITAKKAGKATIRVTTSNKKIYKDIEIVVEAAKQPITPDQSTDEKPIQKPTTPNVPNQGTAGNVSNAIIGVAKQIAPPVKQVNEKGETTTKDTAKKEKKETKKDDNTKEKATIYKSKTPKSKTTASNTPMLLAGVGIAILLLGGFVYIRASHKKAK